MFEILVYIDGQDIQDKKKKSCLSCLSMLEILVHIDGQDIQDKKY
jgi:hypothetical protein